MNGFPTSIRNQLLHLICLGFLFCKPNRSKPKLVKTTHSGLEIISRLAPVKLSGQTYFCSDTTHFWPDKYPLRHISIKFSPPHPHMMFTYQTSTFSTPLLYMQPRTHCRKSGTHGVTAMFGKIIITFVHTNIASVPCLLYGEILIPTKVMKLMKLKLAM